MRKIEPHADDPCGVIITGVSGQPDGAAILATVTDALGARFWYQYDETVPDSPDPAIVQVRLLRYPDLGLIDRYPHATAWMIGNEPNSPDQDSVAPDAYATWAHDAIARIHTVNKDAAIIGPNTLNWDKTCTACGGFQSGLDWTTAMRAAYLSAYQIEPPFTVWSVHTYDLQWDALPLTDWQFCAGQIRAFRTYLDTTGLAGVPIWLTEFGVVWGFGGIEWNDVPDGNGGVTVEGDPVGTLKQAAIDRYLRQMLRWLEANRVKLNIERWFVYTTFGLPETFATVYAGISLFDRPPQPGAALTNAGSIYRGAIKRALAPHN